MKTAAERLIDTKNYMMSALLPGQYNEVFSKLQTAPNQTAISDALSIGQHDPVTKAARRAKRSLMLLALLYINDQALRNGEVARVKNLAEGSEQPLIEEIKSWFVLPGVTEAMVANHAKTNIDKMPKWHNVNYEAPDAIRGVYRIDKPFNCYNGCVFWAFQAGAISKRYLWNKLQGKDGNAFFPIYSQVGWDTVIDHDGQRNLIRDTSNGGEVIVPAGRTVYFETPVKVFGHVACSLGDGTVISQNSVNIGDTAIAGLAPPSLRAEFSKMANAVTHIVSIRAMLTHYFNPEHGYKSLKTGSNAFWENVPIGER
jgi:hypothetical protein